METKLEKVLFNSGKDKMQSYVKQHPDSFKELISLAIADKQPYSWRAAWLLWSCMDSNDKRIRGHVREIVNVLPKRKDNHQRELIKILEQMEIKEEFEGVLFNNCVSIWEKINKQPSVRFYAFKTLTKIAKSHPELSKEIISLSGNQYTESLSPGIKNSVYRMIKDMI